MRQQISPESGRDLLSFLSGQYVVELCDGAVQVHCTDLSADCVSAAVEKDDVLHVFVDLKKPAAALHARQMLREWLGMEFTVPVEPVTLARVD